MSQAGRVGGGFASWPELWRDGEGVQTEEGEGAIAHEPRAATQHSRSCEDWFFCAR